MCKLKIIILVVHTNDFKDKHRDDFLGFIKIKLLISIGLVVLFAYSFRIIVIEKHISYGSRKYELNVV